jgi:hypothetical protein
METLMKIATPVIIALACAVGFAGPAFAAKTSLAKGGQLCKAEADKQSPEAKSVRIADGETRTSDTHLWFTLNVRKADDTSAKFACVVDREAQTVQFSEKQ